MEAGLGVRTQAREVADLRQAVQEISQTHSSAEALPASLRHAPGALASTTAAEDGSAGSDRPSQVLDRLLLAVTAQEETVSAASVPHGTVDGGLAVTRGRALAAQNVRLLDVLLQAAASSCTVRTWKCKRMQDHRLFTQNTTRGKVNVRLGLRCRAVKGRQS